MNYLPNKQGFLGFENKFNIKEKAVVVPFGLEKTVSYGGGTKNGPKLDIFRSQIHTPFYINSGSAFASILVPKWPKFDTILIQKWFQQLPNTERSGKGRMWSIHRKTHGSALKIHVFESVGVPKPIQKIIQKLTNITCSCDSHSPQTK